MKIGIVSVLPEVIAMLQQSLLLRPAHKVLWIAHDNARALQLCVENRPELLLMDLTNPAQGALDAIGKIMEMTPCAVLLVTRDVSANSARVFDAMGFGAIDVVDTLRFVPGSQMLLVRETRSFKDGVLCDVYYWCEKCQLRFAHAGPCICCGMETELWEEPLKK